MKLEVTIEPHDSLELHQLYEKLFIASHPESKDGMEPIELKGKFRFMPDFEVSQQPRWKQYKTGRTTKFTLIRVLESGEEL